MSGPLHQSRSAQAERRHLTVLFCDLVESTPLAGELDPEDFREVIRAFQETCVEAIERFDGYVAQYSGDGLVAYFGYPRAHEDDPQRAVRAGLGIVAAMGGLNARLEANGDVHLAVRVGIDTGPAVVGEIGAGTRREQSALGETLHIAARLQGVASPDSVVIGTATHRLVQGYFTTKSLGEKSLRGIARPVSVYQVVEESGVRTRLELAGPTGLTPLVGREHELGLLLRRWQQTKAGHGQVILVSGEPGIGKSRLVKELDDRLGDQEHASIIFRCSPYYADSALHPVIEHLERLFELEPDDTPDERLRKLDRVVARYRLLDPESVPLFASLLSIVLPNDAPRPELPPEQAKKRTFELLRAWLIAEAERKPAIAICEDLQWADPSTLELLELLLEQVPSARLLVLITTRPEFRAGWATCSFVSQLRLTRFASAQIMTMIDSVLGGKTLPPELLEQISAKTDGVPLFVEELVKMILESGLVTEQNGQYVPTGALPPLAIPETLQDSLMARLDNLGAAKQTAQLGATLGREFALDLIEAVSPADRRTLHQHLGQLVAAELLFQRGQPPDARYQFKHALVQDVAYQSLLKSTRQEHHRRVALVLESRFPDTAEAQPELLAHHYTEAGFGSEAVAYWQRAGARALERSANVEAVRQIANGLEVLATLPDNPERAAQELELRILLGNALIATEGYAAPDVGESYRRARELAEQLGEESKLLPVLYGLWVNTFVSARFEQARQLGQEFLELAERRNDPAVLVALRAVGWPSFNMGELRRSREHFEQILSAYDPEQHKSLSYLYGQDPGVAARAFGSLTLWYLGYPEQALARSEEGISVAREVSHPLSLAYALAISAQVHLLRGEPEKTRERAEAAIALATEYRIPLWRAWGTMPRAWALTEAGEREEGIAEMRAGLEAAARTGSGWGRSYFLALLGEASARAGRIDEGLACLDQALAFAGEHRELYYEAEIYRLRGELLLAKQDPEADEAEQCLRRAVEIARQQESRSLELRAAISLARLTSSRGEPEAARELLQTVYGWFVEGFDTRDLQQGSEFLDELRAMC